MIAYLYILDTTLFPGYIRHQNLSISLSIYISIYLSIDLSTNLIGLCMIYIWYIWCIYICIYKYILFYNTSIDSRIGISFENFLFQLHRVFLNQQYDRWWCCKIILIEPWALLVIFNWGYFWLGINVSQLIFNNVSHIFIRDSHARILSLTHSSLPLSEYPQVQIYLMFGYLVKSLLSENCHRSRKTKLG